MKAITLNEIEQIFSITEPLGLSREAVVIPLRTEHPDRLGVLANGKLEIVVDSEADFAEWLKQLGPRIEELMARK